jgi:electron transfer flavoprotein alpha subunit
MASNENVVWVVADQQECNVLPVTFQLIGQARKLADELKTRVAVILLGNQVQRQADRLFAAGADRIYMGDDSQFADYQAGSYTEAIVDLTQKHQPQIMLLGSTPVGRELAPLLAAKLQTGLTAHCIELAINADGILDQKIPAYGGLITIVCPEKRPQMATVAQGVFPTPEMDETRKGEIIAIDVPPNISRGIETVEVVIEEPQGVPLETAPMVVAGGAGAGDKDGWNQIAQLSQELNAALGCTRPAVDEGWAELETMIGQSGKMVSPEVYVGVGLSGEQQHMVGIVGAKLMIAINSDKKSPVFEQVDYGIVDDCREFVPVLIEKIKKYREKKLTCS